MYECTSLFLTITLKSVQEQFSGRVEGESTLLFSNTHSNPPFLLPTIGNGGGGGRWRWQTPTKQIITICSLTPFVGSFSHDPGSMNRDTKLKICVPG